MQYFPGKLGHKGFAEVCQITRKKNQDVIEGSWEPGLKQEIALVTLVPRRLRDTLCHDLVHRPQDDTHLLSVSSN
jgi:hypothetical protein